MQNNFTNKIIQPDKYNQQMSAFYSHISKSKFFNPESIETLSQPPIHKCMFRLSAGGRLGRLALMHINASTVLVD